MCALCGILKHATNVSRIEVSTFTAQGVWEKDEVRKDDSFATFEVSSKREAGASAFLQVAQNMPAGDVATFSGFQRLQATHKHCTCSAEASSVLASRHQCRAADL